MESGNTCGTRIDVQHIQCFVILHLQYMRMSANEKFGRTHQNASPYGRIVIARIAANMFYQHFGTVNSKTIDLRIDLTDVLPVNVAIHGTERTECRQLLRHFQRTDVTGMPDFITRFEILQILDRKSVV